jgi:WD40 repeat protein
VQVRDAFTGLTCLVLHGHDDTVRCLSFTHDGKRLVTGSNDDTARVWDAENGKEIKSLRQTGIWKVSAVSCSLDDRYMIAGGDIIREFDAGNGSEILVLPERESLDDYLRAIAFSPGGERIICQPDDAGVAIFDRELNDWSGKIDGICDVNAIAGGSKLFPFLVHCRWNGVTISETASGNKVAWLPNDINKIVTHRDGRTWIGMNNSQVFHFTLEGIRG